MTFLKQMIAPIDVIDSCKSLVQYEKSSGLVRFSHDTVQEFIADHIQELPPAFHLAKSCLDYLTFDNFEEVPLNARPFRQYAAQFWDAHTREAEESYDVQQAALRLLMIPGKMNSILRFGSEVGFWEGSKGEYPTSLHLVAEKGLAKICKLILATSDKQNTERYKFT